MKTNSSECGVSLTLVLTPQSGILIKSRQPLRWTRYSCLSWNTNLLPSSQGSASWPHPESTDVGLLTWYSFNFVATACLYSICCKYQGPCAKIICIGNKSVLATSLVEEIKALQLWQGLVEHVSPYIHRYRDLCHVWSIPTNNIQCVPLATEPGISLIILPLMRILQRNLKRTYLIV
jgi:hypothetical protein